jgi:hypothetical protein
MKVNVICHVEALPRYPGPNRYFSLNVGVALDGSLATQADLDPRLVSPWEWTVNKIRVFVQRGGALKEIGLLDVVRPPDDHTTDVFVGELKKLLDDRAAELPNAQPFTWSPAGNDPLSRAADELRWHEVLIHTSTFPGELTHKANLAFVFASDLVEDGDIVIAAPVIDFGDGIARTPADPTDPNPKTSTTLRFVAIGTTPLDQPPFFYGWRYGAVGGAADIDAYQRECSATPSSPSDTLIDLKTGWIAPASRDIAPGDWTLTLETRTSEAFDLPQRLIEAIASAPAVTSTQANCVAIADKFLALTRAILGNGGGPADPTRVPPPVAPDLPQLVAREIRADAAFVDDFRQVLAQATVKSDAEWAALLGIERTKLNALTATAFVDELRMLHSRISAEETVREILFQQWDSAIEEARGGNMHQTAVNTWTAKRVAVRNDALAQFGIRRALLLALLDADWPNLSNLDAAVEPDQQKHFADLLKTALAPRLTLPAGFGDVQAAIDNYLPVFTSALAAKVILDVLPDAADEHDALIVQIADASRIGSDATDAADQQDSARRISGYGVLLRPKTDDDSKDWSCLNLARLVAPGGGSDDEMADVPLPVALRLGYRSGIRQSFVVYENHPLVAESPLNTAIRKENRLGDSLGSDSDPFFAYRNPYGIDQNAPRLHALVYGTNYEVAPFTIGNGGTLPVGLAADVPLNDGSGGTVLVPWRMRKLDNTLAIGQRPRVLKFRRRTGPGRPRVRPARDGSDTPFEELPLPLIPASVHPIARSLKEPVAATAPTPAEQLARGSASRPLVLLRTRSAESKLNSFAFRLLPPAVDINVWDRWTAIDNSAAARERRANVWAAYHFLADETGPAKNDKRGDLTVDDPAVTHWRIRLTNPESGNSIEPHGPIALTPRLPAGATPSLAQMLDLARFKPLAVTVRTNKDVSVPSVTVSGETVSIDIPDGEVWTIEIHAAMDKDVRAARFAGNVKPTTSDGNAIEGISRLAFDVETTPAAIAFAQPALLDAITTRVKRSADRDRLEIGMKPAGIAAFSRWIYRVEVILQQWRWSGRPPERKDNSLIDPSRPIAREDDGVLFADRGPLDILVVPGSVDFVQSPAPATIHSHDVTASKGALYFRVGVRCFSRYEGIGEDEPEMDSRLGKDEETYARVVVPCRWDKDDVPAPHVKLLLPLTRSMQPSDTAAPLLAVMDEPWGDIGGLGEQLVVEVVRAEALTDGGAPLAELGPDPILSLRPFNLGTMEMPKPIGPIGYTFDTDTTAPLFVRSSFIILPPGGVTDDLAWSFAKLQFRRRLIATPDDAQNAKYSELPNRMTADRLSDPTPPMWGQFVPPSTSFRTSQQPIDVSDLSLRLEHDVPRFVDRSGSTIALLPLNVADGSSSVFELYVVLTERITDAGGHRDQEAYASTFVCDASGALLHNSGATVFANPQRLRARVLEVQRRKNDSSGADLWSDIFPNPAVDKDAKARIVRMSPPVDTTS